MAEIKSIYGNTLVDNVAREGISNISEKVYTDKLFVNCGNTENDGSNNTGECEVALLGDGGKMIFLNANKADIDTVLQGFDVMKTLPISGLYIDRSGNVYLMSYKSVGESGSINLETDSTIHIDGQDVEINTNTYGNTGHILLKSEYGGTYTIAGSDSESYNANYLYGFIDFVTPESNIKSVTISSD